VAQRLRFADLLDAVNLPIQSSTFVSEPAPEILAYAYFTFAGHPSIRSIHTHYMQIGATLVVETTPTESQRPEAFRPHPLPLLN
jgi:hypothetical protein